MCGERRVRPYRIEKDSTCFSFGNALRKRPSRKIERMPPEELQLLITRVMHFGKYKDRADYCRPARPLLELVYPRGISSGRDRSPTGLDAGN